MNAIAVIDTRKCTGCGRCVGACPLHLLSLEPKNWVKHAVIDDVDTCTGCGKCKTVCPFNAIRMHADRVTDGRRRWPVGGADAPSNICGRQHKVNLPD